MAEDPQPQSIAQRIAALNSSHIGRIPGDPPLPRSKPALPVSRPALTQRQKTINNPPARVNGSVTSAGIGNQPNAAQEKELLPRL